VPASPSKHDFLKRRQADLTGISKGEVGRGDLGRPVQPRFVCSYLTYGPRDPPIDLVQSAPHSPSILSPVGKDGTLAKIHCQPGAGHGFAKDQETLGSEDRG